MTNEKTAAHLLPETPAATTNQATIPQYSTVFAALPLTLKATPAMQFCAKHLTQGRQRGKHLAAPSASIGTAEQDFEATYYGTLAEVLLYIWLEQQGQMPEYTLLDTRAVTEADFRLDGIRYEVKCSPPGKAYLAISERQHNDPRRRCDFYLCALFDAPDTLRFCLPVPHATVSSWRRMTNGHEPYYSIHRDELLQPVASPVRLPNRTDSEATAAFFRALLSGFDDPSLRLEIRLAWPAWQQALRYPNGDAPGNWQFRAPRAWFALDETGLQRAAEHALQLSGRYEVYFGVLPRRGEGGKAADVPAACCLWCDIDGGDEGVKGAQARLAEAVGKGLLPLPDFTVCSGGGLHVYWRLTEPVPLPDEAARRAFKDTLKRLCRVIGGEAPAAHADSSRADIASILRVPGTFNRKREHEPRPVTLLPGPPAEPHTITWWNARLPALPLPPPAKQPARPLYDPAACEGLVRWAKKPFPEGKRHKDFASAAKWLHRDKGLDKSIVRELLLMKAQASPGKRMITAEEVEAILQWA